MAATMHKTLTGGQAGLGMTTIEGCQKAHIKGKAPMMTTSYLDDEGT
jgi:hypothetical protein